MEHLDISILGKLHNEYLDTDGNLYNVTALHDDTIVLALVGCGFRNREYEELTDDDIKNIKECEYICETVSCEECGAQHDSDNSTWSIVDECTNVCNECRKAEDVLIDLTGPTDLFKAKNTEGVDLTRYEEVECLFCDASGFGQDWERALTKEQAEHEAERVMAQYPDETLKVGITGIGQFQVWVSIFKNVG
jgi:hypothetical protein